MSRVKRSVVRTLVVMFGAVLVLGARIPVAMAAPANDNFPGATLDGLNGSVSGSTVDATAEDGEPCHWDCTQKSVWFTWQPASTGIATFQTSSSSYDAVLAAYTGAAVNSLSLIASNNDLSGATTEARMTFEVVAGGTYRIAVDGLNGAAGTFTLNWSTIEAPSNDTFPGATISTTTGSIGGTTVAATAQPGELCHWDCSQNSVWYTWVAPGTGIVTVQTTGSSYNPVLAVYSGAAVNNLSLIASNDDASTSTLESIVSLQVYGGQTYRIAVDGLNESTGTFTLAWSEVLAAANDPFANATILTGYYGSRAGTNYAATGETGELCHWDCTQKSVWYSWTAPVSGLVRFRTTGSSFNPTMAAYTGSAVDSLSTIASNDDASTSTVEPLVSFVAAKGTRYRIAVDGLGGTSGPFTLRWSYVYRPDGLIKLSGDSSYLGNNIYNLTAASQTRATKAHRSSSRTFYVAIGNDGTATDSFKVKGSANSTGFTVRYYYGSTNVTSAVTGGTYTLGSIPVGGSRVLKVVVTVASNATLGAVKSVVLTTWSTHATGIKDVVKGTVKVY